MKPTALLFIISSLSFTLSQAQTTTTDKLQLDEAARVDVERSTISKQLMQLRDSINVSIKLAGLLEGKAKTETKRTDYSGAKATLTEYHNRVKADLEETSLTARNSWTGDSEKRLKISINDTRREFNRIRRTALK